MTGVGLFIGDFMNKLLFLIHPNHAIENWPNDPEKLKAYYDDVMNYVREFDGKIVIHLMHPAGIGVNQDEGHALSWKLHDEFVEKIKHLADVIDFDRNKLGCTFGKQFDELLLEYNPQEIFIGGGYYGMCLRQTYNELHKQYGSYLKELGTKIYKVPSIIYVPGPRSHRLSDTDLDEYQKDYVSRQSGKRGVRDFSDYEWEGMPDGESLEISEDVEIILDGEKYLLEEGDRIFLK